MTIVEERLAYLESLQLEVGAHAAPNNGLAHACVMEAVAYVAGEPWSDNPECSSPVIAAFLRSWNDSLGDEDRQMLKPLIPRLVDTRASIEIEYKRAWMATDWLVRECAPAFLRLGGLSGQAELLEKLTPVLSTEAAVAAQPNLEVAREDAAAARAAARAAAWAAARAAAWAGARAAARAAAWDAARAAAWDAAWDAAWAAAWDAAWDAAGAAARAAAWAVQTDILFDYIEGRRS